MTGLISKLDSFQQAEVWKNMVTTARAYAPLRNGIKMLNAAANRLKNPNITDEDVDEISINMGITATNMYDEIDNLLGEIIYFERKLNQL